MNKYIVKFHFEKGYFISMPVLAAHPENIQAKITNARQEQVWLSFPAMGKLNKVLGQEGTSINMERVCYFQIEIPTRAALESFDDSEYIRW